MQLYSDAIAGAADASLTRTARRRTPSSGSGARRSTTASAPSPAPNWGKAYSRCGVAALELNDEESSYWFCAFGLKRDPAGGDQALELRRGRDAALKALMGANTARMRRRRDAAAATPAGRRLASLPSATFTTTTRAKEWAARLSTTEYRNDAIIVAGDVGDTFVAVRTA